MWCHGCTAAVRHGRRQSDHVLGATQRVPAQQGSRRRDRRRRERGRRGPALRREPPVGVQDQTTMGRRRRFRAPAPFPRRAHDSQGRRRPGLTDRRTAQTTGKGRPGRRSRIHRRQAGARGRQAAGELHDPPHPRERRPGAPRTRETPKASYTRFEASPPDELWQSDFTHWPIATVPGAVVVSRLDDHSRNPLHARAFATVTMDDVQVTFLQACAEHGIPARTLTDNGTVYTTRPISAAPGRFERTLALMGVRQSNGRPCHPRRRARSNATTAP